MSSENSARRITMVASGVVAAASVYLAVRAGDGPVLGPARTDDLPYGDILRLDRPGAIVWTILATFTLGAAWLNDRRLLLVSAAAWGLLSVVATAVVVGQSGLWGMSRPSDLALALGLTASTMVTAFATGLDPAADVGSDS